MTTFRIMFVVLMIVLILFAAFMLADQMNDELSLSKIDSYESVGHRRFDGDWWTLEDAFEMDITAMCIFNIIPLAMIIGFPFCVYQDCKEAFKEESR